MINPPETGKAFGSDRSTAYIDPCHGREPKAFLVMEWERRGDPCAARLVSFAGIFSRFEKALGPP